MRKPIMVAALLLSSPVLAAEADGSKFWGSVQKDDQHIISYYVTVPPGETATLTLGSGFKLEFSAAPSEGEGQQSEVRLFDSRGKLLHDKKAPGNSPMNVSGAYSLCRGSFAYLSPAPTEPAGCEE